MRIDAGSTGGSVRHYLPCVTCEYNLYGASVEANCSECGTPVVRSLADTRLEFVDVARLNALRNALAVLVLGATFLPLAVLLLIGVYALLVPSSYAVGEQTAGWGIAIALIVSWILCAIGAMLATSRTASSGFVSERFRWFVRFLVLLGPYGMLLAAVCVLVIVERLLRACEVNKGVRLSKVVRILMCASTGVLLLARLDDLSSGLLFVLSFSAGILPLAQHWRLLARALDHSRQFHATRTETGTLPVGLR